MQTVLFSSTEENDHLDFHYSGSSFQGRIDIDDLSKELEGLSRALKKVIVVTARHDQSHVSLKDISIVVEPFTEGSFRKKVRVLPKKSIPSGKVNNYITAGLLLCEIIGLIKSNGVSEITKMSPQLQVRIRDQVKVELLKDPSFLKDVSALSAPLMQLDDKLVLTHSSSTKVELDISDKKMLEAVTMLEDDVSEYKASRILVGRVTRVDLDATINHIGFKVDDKGATINCTFIEDMNQSSKRNLLGAWVRLEGLVTYKGKEPIKIDISAINEAVPPKQGVLLPKD